MQLDIDELSPVRKRVRITVPAAKVDAGFSRAYQQIAQRVSLPGFRKGKVPMSHLRKRFGDQATAEVTERLLTDGWRQAMGDLSINPIGEPELDTGAGVAQGQDFHFSITVDVTPTIALQPYDSLTVEREVFVASEAVVDHELEHLAEQLATWTPVEDRTVAQTGDMAVLDYAGSVDGEAFPGGTAEDAELELGSGRFIPGFEEQIVGQTVGAPCEVRVTFPADYGAESLAGKQAIFACTLKDLKVKTVPEIGQPLADHLGSENLDAVKVQLKARIEARFNDGADEEAKKVLRARLAAQYDFPLPDSLVDSGTEQKRSTLVTEAVQGGASFDEARADVEGKLDALREEVIAEVRAELVLDEIADKEAIDVDLAEVNAQIEKMVRVMGEYGARLRTAYRDPNRRAGLQRRMRQDKVLDFLLVRANVTTVEQDVPAHDHGHADEHEHGAHEAGAHEAREDSAHEASKDSAHEASEDSAHDHD